MFYMFNVSRMEKKRVDYLLFVVAHSVVVVVAVARCVVVVAVASHRVVVVAARRFVVARHAGLNINFKQCFT